ncbi:PREDICTED: zinc finger and BTB domain-containing protein 11 [Nanorana parkeri]|uniref:zinc finger and BTB domain-containing protein 11 n=1 Tax=Nanorana parkeri TaxID=125878 RepID=UPI0008550401|nr:PREDICTED: zinc finger and BTB domain-containing protein 11 [Nanorana parkeri]
MSSEESYLAILRYLTNEREPYAPGTEGNVKRKIRKAAACYVVRDGILYYQRRHRDKERFTELEVVLQPDRRKGLIQEAHIGEGGLHLTRLQTWHLLSKRYWWRGILKEMKDYIKKCNKCQEKMDRSRLTYDPSEMLEEFGLEVQLDETDDEGSLPVSSTCADPKPAKKKSVAKHELVFVDSKGTVKQSSSKHSQAVLDQLNQQRLANQFCDVTLLIEGEEYKAHKSVLAASSEYFRELFIEKGAVSSHEAFVDLSGFCKSSFLPLLEFAYTSELVFDFCSMADLAMLARHLYMHEVLEICESIHKKMEEKRLTLYQQGDVQTVASEKNMLNVHIQGPTQEDKTTSPVVIEGTDEQQILSENNMECQIAAQTHSSNNIIAIASPEKTVISTQVSVQLTSDNVAATSVDGSTAVYISNISNAPLELQSAVFVPAVIEVASVQPESHQIVVECLDAQPLSLINKPASEVTDCDNAAKDSEEVLKDNTLQTHMECQGSPCVEDIEGDMDVVEEDAVKNKNTLKRKHDNIPRSPNSPGEGMMSEAGIPDSGASTSSEGDAGARTSIENTAFAAASSSIQDSPTSSDEGPYKCKLRERSIEEGGYIQMHRGKERKYASRKTNQKSAVQQVARKLVERGKKRMLPPKNEVVKEEEEHACKECGMVFGRKYALIMHGIKHNHKAKEFKCPLCKKEFQYRASLRAHLIRHARRTEPSVVEVEREVTKGAIKRQYICDICGRTLPKMCSLRMHMLKHTGVKPHACQICDKAFTHKHGLKMHQALHETERRFKCDMCDKSFVTNRSLQEHVSTHTGETKYVCTVCGKTYHRASGLSKHLKKHRPKADVQEYHCTQCERHFSEARDLQQHMNKHLGVKPFECEICGKCYSWKKDWYSHVKSHSVTEPFRCNICGKEFFEKSLYRRHVNKATHGKKGRIKRNIERVCTHCGKSFSQLREFRRHVNNHEGVKPFECLTCGVAWADARSLKRHVRTHTGERPYVCPVCNEAYIDARNLRKHMTKYHNNYIPCKIMLEKDSLQFHHQGTQVEHAVSFVPNELVEAQSEIVSEDMETVLVAENVVDSEEAITADDQEGTAVSSLSDQSIMQVVNYVLAQQQGAKLEVTDQLETVEVEVDHVSDVL